MRLRPLLLLTLVGASVAPAVSAQARAASDAEKEQFLLEAQVVRAGGTAGSRSLRATLRRGGVTHEADVLLVDESTPQLTLGPSSQLDARNSWRNNVAAYRLDRLLGLRMVPVTVIRPYETKRAAFTWWQDDLLMTEKERSEKGEQPPDAEAWTRQIQVAKVFDELIYNSERGLGNMLIDRDWRLWMVDHRRAFDAFKELKNEKELPDACPRGLLAALRKLDGPTLKTRAGGLLSRSQIEGVLERRDRIVAHYDRLIAARGGTVVLYDLPDRP